MEKLHTAPPWTPPDAFDDFTLSHPIGKGGMGLVWFGRDVALDRPVALKFISAETPGEEARRRFLSEARALARLTHPNVVHVYRVGEVLGRPYLAYEFVPGQTLERLPQPAGWKTALRVGLGVARGLAAAHRAGLVHRDVKPGNVMLTRAGDVKLLDFGLARSVGGLPEVLPAVLVEGASGGDPRITRPGTVLGTPAYLAPEQWQGEPGSPQSDVWAAGLLLYELLTGPSPRAGMTGVQLARAVLSEPLPPVRARAADVPESLAAVVDRCLSLAPSERYASGVELAAELEALQAVFLPRSAEGAPATLERDSEAVAASFARVASRLDALSARMYELLFQRHPELRGLFPHALDGQREKLAHALHIAIHGLGDPDKLVPVLEDLGRRHSAYGVQPASLDQLGEVLVDALAELEGPRWSQSTETAWRRAYTFLAGTMRRGFTTAASTRVDVSTPQPVPRTPAPRTPAPRTPTPASPPPMPRTQYALNGEVSLAYQVFGEGPVDVVVMLGWLTHVEYAWRHPSLAGFLRRLGQGARVVLYDKRGSGLSDRHVAATPGDAVADLLAVLDAVGSRRAVLMGLSDGAAYAAGAAAAHPDRVAGLVLYGGAPKLLRADDYPHGHPPEFMAQIRALVLEQWGEPVWAQLQAPSLAQDPAFVGWLGEFMRMASSPGNALAMLRGSAAFDVRPELARVACPTLVLHRTADPVAPLAGSRAMAAGIPRARLVELPGVDHVPWAGDGGALWAEVETFLASLA